MARDHHSPLRMNTPMHPRKAPSTDLGSNPDADVANSLRKFWLMALSCIVAHLHYHTQPKLESKHKQDISSMRF